MLVKSEGVLKLGMCEVRIQQGRPLYEELSTAVEVCTS